MIAHSAKKVRCYNLSGQIIVGKAPADRVLYDHKGQDLIRVSPNPSDNSLSFMMEDEKSVAGDSVLTILLPPGVVLETEMSIDRVKSLSIVYSGDKPLSKSE